MTEQVNAKAAVPEELSEQDLYEQEWADSTDGVDAKKTTDGETTATPEVVAKSEGSTVPDAAQPAPAEGTVELDIWATATEEQKQAFLKATGDFKSVVGRHTSAEKRAAAAE